MNYRFAASIVAVVSTISATTVRANAENQSPTVVELFTSQGCSSCPPANSNLIKISNRPGILALSFSVTYWDKLGWKDTYGKPEFTERQVLYEPGLNKQGPYTPQMVFDGRSTVIGNRMSEIETALADSQPKKGPTVTLSKRSVEIGPYKYSSTADVWLVRYDPSVKSVPIERGENQGSTLQHAHVVRSLQRLGIWNGKEIYFNLPAREKGLKTAILVQEPNGGIILSAASE
jgi:hypothetical protein